MIGVLHRPVETKEDGSGRVIIVCACGFEARLGFFESDPRNRRVE